MPAKAPPGRLPDLHPILRIYVGCAELLAGDLREIDVIKLHKRSGKVSLLRYDDFERTPLPELIERIRVNLSQQDLDADFGPTKQELLSSLDPCLIAELFPTLSANEKLDQEAQSHQNRRGKVRPLRPLQRHLACFAFRFPRPPSPPKRAEDIKVDDGIT